jgi:hypothetical protein
MNAEVCPTADHRGSAIKRLPWVDFGPCQNADRTTEMRRVRIPGEVARESAMMSPIIPI